MDDAASCGLKVKEWYPKAKGAVYNVQTKVCYAATKSDEITASGLPVVSCVF